MRGYVLLCTYGVTRYSQIMNEATFTFRVDDSLKSAFTQAAQDKDRTGAQLLRDFMRDFVREQEAAAAHDAWFRREVQAGLESANAGELIDAEDVEAEAAAWRAQTRRKLADAES